MLDYIIKVLLFQTLFLAVYDLLLKRETFFQWNRAYLLVTSLVAYVIPLLKINRIAEAIPQEYVVVLPEVLLSPSATIKESIHWSTMFFTSLTYLFWIGACVASFVFARKLYNVVRMIYTNEKERQATYHLVQLDDHHAFSFFNYIFLGEAISEERKKQIITHELVHVRQKHSVDLLFFELQKIICWFNPFSYIFQQRISELHEFIADAKAIKAIEKSNYFEHLLSQTFKVCNISFINPFLKISLIKKRIVMLNKGRSKQVLKFKYLLVVPILLSMLIYTSCEKGSFEERKVNRNNKRLTTLFVGEKNGSVSSGSTSKKEGYFDLYLLGATPTGIEISYNDLSDEEKLEYDEIVANFMKLGKGLASYTIFENEQGQKSLKQVLDWSKRKEKTIEDYVEGDDIPFAVINDAPIFPGCENAEDPKECFNVNMHKYIAQNFDIALAKKLGLEPGKKKIYVQFSIDTSGNVIQVKSRAPHRDLETEAINLVNGLPKMTPGKHKGKYVNVTYVLPISFVVD